MKKISFITTLFASCTLAQLPLVSCGLQPDEPTVKFQNMFDNYKEWLTHYVDTSAFDDMSKEDIIKLLEETTVTGDLETETPAYKFKDLDYESKATATWPPHQHLRRMSAIAVLGAKRNDENLLDIANKLMNFWLGNKFTNTNWWMGIVGVPQELTVSYFFINTLMTDKGKARCLSDIYNGTFQHNPGGTKNQKGTNLFFCAENSFKCAIFEQDSEAVDLVFECINKELKEYTGDHEGFQDDGSYFQHDMQIYNGGYGRQGMQCLCRILSAYQGEEEIPFSNDQIKILSKFALEGMKYFTHKGCVNYQVLGRAYTKKDAQLMTGGITDDGNVYEYEILKQFDPDRKEELEDLYNRWHNNQSSFSGIKYFPRSCMLVMNIDDLYMSFRGTKEDLRNSEKVNGENRIGYFMSLGTNTCVLDRGDEYLNASPVWDYSCIPGTTSTYISDEELDKLGNGYFELKQDGTFNGGYDKDANVAYSMQQTRRERRKTDETTYEHFIDYTVTCFGTKDGMVILGAGLNNDNPENDPLHTTVQQCVVTGDVSISPDLKTVKHGNAVYKNLEENSTFSTTVDEVTGAWSRNNKDEPGQTTQPVLKILIDDNTPDHYAYCIQPKTKENVNFKVAHNDANSQAIELEDGSILAAFYKQSSFEYNGQTYSGEKNTFKIFNKV